nr:Flp pilus assembly complex ATPase component TadA [Burkholderiales bacterium]
MAAAAASINLSPFARALVLQGRLQEVDAKAIQVEAGKSNVTFIEQLTQSKKLKSAEICQFAAQTFGYPQLDLSAVDFEAVPRNLVETKFITSHRVLPLGKRGNRLFLAVSDPTNQQALDEIKFATGLVIEPVVVEDGKLGTLIRKMGDSGSKAIESLVPEDFDLLGEEGQISDGAPAEDTTEVDDAPVVKYLQKIMLDAINGGASDIHFEPYEKYYRIRYRTDGTLFEVAQPPLIIKDKLSSRIKVISKMDISEKRVPQDGRMKLTLSKTRAIDFRVSTLPTLYGEKIVMRILDPTSATLGIEALGYEPEQKEAMLTAIARPYGMILVTGPTGSGKTVSLYTCLNLLNKPGINISTAEDPAEINLPGVNQVNVNDKAGLTFSVALKAFLRQDPDIIMVGEVRDLETGEIAVKAAQT